jgi:hypothetical protein
MTIGTQRPTRALSLLIIVFMLALTISPLAVGAQAPAPDVTKTAEYNIGFDCPVSATLDPDQTTLWILMDNCITKNFTLQGFKLADGSPIDANADHFVDTLAPLDGLFPFSNTMPLAFTPDGIADVLYNENENYDTRNLRISLTTDQAPASTLTLLTNDTLQDLIPGYAGYPETITYNSDHTLAVVADTTIFHIIDLKVGKDLLQVEALVSTDYSTASFSKDNQHLYITTAKNLEDANDTASTLNIYSLPDGKLLKTYDVPSFWNIVSPDERYVAAPIGGQYDAALLITDLEMGSISQPILVNEPAHKVMECLNTKKNVSDVDFKASGELPVRDLIWLPDSSGFLTVNSYLGQRAGGRDSICNFDYSRLRVYHVQ